MHRARIYLAILVYFTLVKRLLSKPLSRLALRINQKLAINSASNGQKKNMLLHRGFEFFINGGMHLNLGLEQGFLNQYLRN